MPDILHRVGVNAQPEPVLKALTTIDGVRGWWDSGAKGDAAEGGTFAFRGGQMKVLEANPNLVAPANVAKLSNVKNCSPAISILPRHAAVIAHIDRELRRRGHYT